MHNTKFTSANARELVRQYDVVADGTDNFPTRYLVNDACVLEGKVNVYASIYRFEGQASVFNELLPDGTRGPITETCSLRRPLLGLCRVVLKAE